MIEHPTRTGDGSGADDASNTEDERLNDKFHALLREAAEKREGRARIHSSEDAAAAKQESMDLLGLARDPDRLKRP